MAVNQPFPPRMVDMNTNLLMRCMKGLSVGPSAPRFSVTPTSQPAVGNTSVRPVNSTGSGHREGKSALTAEQKGRNLSTFQTKPLNERLMTSIYCTNYKLGCEWAGKLSILKPHLESEKGCGYVEVSRTNKCKQRLKRKYLFYHLAHNCHLCKYRCRYCGKIDTYQTITEKHYDECPSYPLNCPNECGATRIRRVEMVKHRSTCPMELVDCSNRCKKQLLRKHLEDHLTQH